jgi:hypothetical protein
MAMKKISGGFSRQGVFIGEGAASEVDQGGLTHRGCEPGAGRAALLCGRPVAFPPSPLWSSGSFVK